MATCREIFTFSWPLRGRGGGGQPKRSAWPLFPSFFFDPFPKKIKHMKSMIMKIKTFLICGKKLISCVFSCQCARCSDPTELGTHMWDLTTLSSVQCSLWMLWQNLIKVVNPMPRGAMSRADLPLPSPLPHINLAVPVLFSSTFFTAGSAQRFSNYTFSQLFS